MTASNQRIVLLPHVSRLLYGLAAFVVIVAGMHAAADLLGLLFVSILLALTFTPLLNGLMRRGIPRGTATLGTILLVLVGGLVLSMLLGASIARLIGYLPTYEPRVAVIRENVRGFMAAHGIALSDVVGSQALNPSRAIALAGWLLGVAGQAISTSLLVLVLVAMMLLEAPDFGERLGGVGGVGGVAGERGTGEESFASRFGQVGETIKRYVAITGWLGLLNAALNLVLLLILGVDAPLLWAVLSFILCFVPVVGNLLALAPPSIMALLEFGWPRALAVVIGYIVINNVIDYAVRPRYLKHGVGLSPLVIVISLLFWGWVLGPVGVVVAVPLSLLLRKLVLEHFHETRTLAAMMAPSANASPSVTAASVPTRAERAADGSAR